jgi:glycosyltransferase involved in cell wall biosynthesis
MPLASETLRVSIVIPARNEADSISLVCADLFKVIPELENCTCEVICVDDHSTDRTAEIAASYGCRVLQNHGPSGKGRALRAGFAAATGDVIVMMDADYSHRAEDLPAMLAPLMNGTSGLVIGSRLMGGSDEFTRVRALGNLFLTAVFGLCHERYLTDALNGYKAFRREVFVDFAYTSNSFEIEIELLVNALRKGYRLAEVSSHERERHGGEAKSRAVRHGTRFLWRILWEKVRRPVVLRKG